MPLPLSPTLGSAELQARLRLHQLPDVGPQHYQRLLQAFGSAEQACRASAQAWRAAGVRAGAHGGLSDPAIEARVDATMRWLEHPGQHLLMLDSPAYPALLAQTDAAPPLLFVAGDPGILERPQLAIVGSRRASRPGMDTAAAFARSLAGGGFVVTSGLALGVDGAAHAGALAVGGLTVGVLGTGLENFYPQRHKRLAEDMIAGGGAVLSEFPLHTPPGPSNFPRRNRIISGLSLGVLVVEASLASGSLITARLAAEQGREVYAIPGSIHHPGAKGCHQLIRDGAVLVESIEHIMQALRGWQQPSLGTATAADAHPLFALLLAAPQSSEALARASGWEITRVLSELTELELQSRVVNEAGRWFARVT
ncbi:DNA-processing protein DprA [Pseudomonas sp. HR96]|uniref:DNA-processing protein DprA n=1 Tax=Pseudomonas sp. HR96 TaxID=1027966 RepID=UPI002A757C50|nr:DNA-processing protein DprA [Pseudomonas sp. HR96]WPO99921.1 DNA-processing protein DprA [Pseudomonas sp. HR96]